MEDVNIDESAKQVTEEEPVGLEDDAEKIIKLLTRGIRERDTVSIFGMPGLGKTTLAKKIFKDSAIVSHFDVRAWLTISQSYNVRELLRNIYKQVTGVEYGDKESDIADTLRKCLMGKRYLIVLDDVWEVDAWDELRLCFPIGKQGNRIMLTTRLKHVAMEVKNCTDPYSPQFLTKEASWKLLQEKAFQKETCPPELQDVGVQIAEYCKGLPLTVVLIGGILAKKARSVSEWCEVANNLTSHHGSVESESNLAIQLSYCYLPDHLRHCLLTMGVFREDEKFGASKLMLLWVAEGLVQRSDERGLEEVAEGYLSDIISSSLLMVTKTTFDGKVKYLQIHDLVRDFVLNKAKEEKFMQVIGTHNQYQPSYDEEHRVCIHLDDKLRDDLKRFNNKVDRFLTSGSTSFGQDLKSLFVTNNADDFIAYRNFWFNELYLHGHVGLHGHVSEEFLCRSYYFSSVGDLRLLRVLDFKNCIPGDSTNIVDILQSLVYLRYLGMCFDMFFFKWVSHMCDLETLLVDTERIVEGTPHIWKMTKLKHVDVETLLPREIFAVSEEGPSKLENLRAFRRMVLSHEDIKLIERFPNLQKLHLTIVDEPSSLVLKMDVLTQLQSLVLESIRSITKYYLPSSLKQLTLQQVNILASATSTLAALPNLQRLIFRLCNFEQEEWDVRDMEFPVLKILKFRNIHLKEWHVSESSSFPMLESLVLRSVELLEKIPDSFVDIGTLTSIKVIYCDDNLKASALDIKEEVEATTGCDNLKVDIRPHYSREQKEKEEEEEAEKKEDEEEEDDIVTELSALSFETFNLGYSSGGGGGSRSRKKKTEGRRRSSNIKSRKRKERG